MPEAFKVCPICEASNHPNMAVCATCGTTLPDSPIKTPDAQAHSGADHYTYRYGETDLYENDLRRTGRLYIIGVTAGLVAVFLLGLIMMNIPFIVTKFRDTTSSIIKATTTPTPRPTLDLPTVTLGPPTASPTPTPPPPPTPTITPTPEPCYQEVLPNDGLYAIVGRCGHRHLDVIDLVVQINNLADANSIRQGDIIEVPWPTSTPDPNAVPTDLPEDDQSADVEGEVRVVSVLDDDFDPFFVPTATLPPGIQFHQVQNGEDIITIGYYYNATIRTLSQLNPEIDFSLCDLGATFGGSRCTIVLQPGQYVRVPAPTPTPTLPPTLTGSETTTPTPTATFNAPIAESPDDRMFFLRDTLITLRWIPTGTLGEAQVYRVRVEDITAGKVYVSDTREIAFVIPAEWRGTDEPRHEYIWTVSVINLSAPESPLFTTESHIFVWEGKKTE